MQAGTAAKPRPKIDSISRGFWDHARSEKLSVQKCDSCAHVHFPGSPVCPQCLSENQSWVPVSGKGTLLSWVRFHRAYWEGFRADLPYVVCLVGLEEGPMLMTRVIGAAPEALTIGMQVEVAFEKIDEEVTLPVFRISD